MRIFCCALVQIERAEAAWMSIHTVFSKPLELDSVAAVLNGSDVVVKMPILLAGNRFVTLPSLL